jgi:DNA polymerase-3 subunit delta
LEKTISSSRPPIFWKNKEIIKQQIIKWKSNNIKKLIFDLNNIELQIKKNSLSSINILTNFIIDQSN